MNFPATDLPGLGSSEIAQRTRAFARSCNVPADHRILASVYFARRVAAMMATGAVPGERLRNRMYCKPDVVPQLAVLLGLVDPATAAAAAAAAPASLAA